jgi:serine/threonine protein kinase
VILSPFLYSSTSSPFFEQIAPKDVTPHDFVDVVKSVVSPNWLLQISFPWTMAAPTHTKLLLQGWKIHLSATEDSANDLLEKALPIICSADTAFKVLTSSRVLKMATSKNWDRRAAGKFVTIYPTSVELCAELMERLAEITDGLTGPYLLTDRQFRTSQVVFYRYGAHLGHNGIAPGGEKEYLIFNPDGNPVKDQRLPYFSPPEWVKDPFSAACDDDSELSGPIVLKNGRYAVDGAFRYSSFGGIYTAYDTLLEEQVVLREARPHAKQAYKRLKFESSMLRRLEPLRRTPRYIDMFTEENHTYLVQSRLKTVTLWGHAAGFLATYEQYRTSRDLLECIVSTFSEIVKGVEEVHNAGFVLRDLTKTNVLFDPSGRCFFIDFELSYDLNGEALWVPGGTAGYVSLNQQNNGRPTVEDDYFALGALLLDMLSFTAPALGIARGTALRACSVTLEECGLPIQLCELVRDLTDPLPEIRPRPQDIQNRLVDISSQPVSRPTDPIMTGTYSPHMNSLARTQVLKDILHVNGRIREHILSHIDWSSNARLWPGSAELFHTNPVCLRFGASGIATYLQRSGGMGGQDDAIWKWIFARADSKRCPAGFYSGLSGVAWAAAQAGKEADAKRLIEEAITRSEHLRSPGIHDGLAGIGLTALSLAQSLKEPKLLEDAVKLAEMLLSYASVDQQGHTMWWVIDTKIPLGYGAGPSGIALFFIHIYRMSGQTKYLRAAKQALDYEVQRLVSIGDRVNLAEFSDTDGKQVSPHVRYGTAGLVSVLLRYELITEDHRFDDAIARSLLTIAGRQTNKLWQDWGLAGFGETLIDASIIRGTEEHYDASLHIARKLVAFACEHRGKITYLGNELFRFSLDYGLGAAGIGSFFSRLAAPALNRIGFFDELLEANTQNHGVTMKLGGINAGKYY